MTEWHPLRPFEQDAASESSRLLWKQLDEEAVERGRFIANNSPAKMPTLDHSSMADYANVYEPSDDTYLLIDAIKYDLFSGYPTDDSRNEDERRTDSEASEDEIIARVALEIYYQHSRIKADGNEAPDESGDDEKHPIHYTVENKGLNEIQSEKISSRLQQLKRLERIETVMEIGTGSGVPITYLSKRLLMEKTFSAQSTESNDNDDINRGFSIIATDLNPLALKFAERTAKENGILVGNTTNSDDIDDGKEKKASVRAMEFVECDLASSLLGRLGGKVDVLLFNPPYVPTDDSEICGNGIEISWAGGQDGRRVTDRALPQIARLLRRPDGVCYMITVDDNLPCELAKKLRVEYGLQMTPLVRRRAFNEYLSVQKISWFKSDCDER
mmetsp:Transcript_11934/g.34219  ORF Transcript_11934/g.34219 Transcript_11934/m.34219 type:complete len:386 (+) Transcript_11934:255-1412(+)|eukprot:CAMPEP_0172369166 /NCGR_PEP_ID=MMETSP1060-20121228/31331_1 /TAXON_ID=37318 /ORGANISM="Pseudo-nitzschia pungens, Strain cf. cingulata" /LENGTH=385 /DNA_ID=CAMNT_0013093991 /DNA_START=187 /DNA_END=1344 /DNA_ORIENTATION=+